MPNITQQQLKEILHYDPETGVFRWRKSVAIRVKPWDKTGNDNGDGYVKICIKAKRYRAHHLAWLYMTGNWPKNQVDHFDGVRHNNSWENLREATSKQNNENLCLAKNNKSGFRGVSWSNSHKKWVATVGHNNKNFIVGYFFTAKEAGAAAAAKRAKLFTHDYGRDQINTI